MFKQKYRLIRRYFCLLNKYLILNIIYCIIDIVFMLGSYSDLYQGGKSEHSSDVIVGENGSG